MDLTLLSLLFGNLTKCCSCGDVPAFFHHISHYQTKSERKKTERFINMLQHTTETGLSSCNMGQLSTAGVSFYFPLTAQLSVIKVRSFFKILKRYVHVVHETTWLFPSISIYILPTILQQYSRTLAEVFKNQHLC